MLKSIVKIVVITILLIHAYIPVQANDDILKADYKNTYIEFNKALQSEKSAQNYLNMCKITLVLNDKNTAKKYCKSALTEIEKEKTPDYELKSDILATIGTIYSTVYHNSDITFEYYNKAKEYKEKNPDTDKYNLAKLYRDIAYAYRYDNNINLSEEYYEKALKICNEEIEDKYKPLIAVIYNDKAIFSEQNNTNKKEYLEKAIANATTAGEYINHKLSAEIYKNIAKYYEINKKDKNTALKYYKKYNEEIAKFPDKNLLIKENKTDEEITLKGLLDNLEEYPYDVDTNIMIGSYYIMPTESEEEEKNPKEYFDKAISVNPDNPYIYAAIASAYGQKYKEANFKEYYAGAREYIKIAEEKANYEPDIYLTLGLVNFNLKSIAVAKKYFEEYIRYSDDKANANCEVASLLWYNDEKGKYRKLVVNYLEKAREIKELPKIYKIMLITSYKDIGNSQKANELATKLLKDDVLNR